MLKLVFFFVSAIVNYSCATNQLDVVRSIKKTDKVLIMSSMDDEFHLYTHLRSAYNDLESVAAMDDWGVSEFAEDTLLAAIQDRYSVAVAEKLRGVDPFLTFDGWSKYYIKNSDVLDFGRDNNAKYMLLLHSSKTPDDRFLVGEFDVTSRPIGKKNIKVYGLNQRQGFFENSAHIYALLYVWLFDVDTGEVIASNRFSLIDGDPVVYYSKEYSGKWLSDFDEVSNENLLSLKEQTYDVIATIINRSVKAMGLKPSKEGSKSNKKIDMLKSVPII